MSETLAPVARAFAALACVATVSGRKLKIFISELVCVLHPDGCQRRRSVRADGTVSRNDQARDSAASVRTREGEWAYNGWQLRQRR